MVGLPPYPRIAKTRVSQENRHAIGEDRSQTLFSALHEQSPLISRAFRVLIYTTDHCYALLATWLYLSSPSRAARPSQYDIDTKMSAAESIVGYADPLTTSPGEVVDFKVSTISKQFTSQILRLGVGPDVPQGPPTKHYPVDDVALQTHAGRLQFGHPGSFIRVDDWHGVDSRDVKSIVVMGLFYATKPKADHEQYLFSTIRDQEQPEGFACLLNLDGGLVLLVPSGGKLHRLDTSLVLTKDVWYDFTLKIYLDDSRLELSLDSKRADLAAKPANHTYVHTLENCADLWSAAPLLIAGGDHNFASTTAPSPRTTFNGKVEAFKIKAKVQDTWRDLLHFDFSLNMSADTVRDISPNKKTGQLINAPTRAVTGHDYDGTWVDWTLAKYGYGAIHFHDDDVDDALWDTSFSVRLPESLLSGFYAALVDDGKTKDYIPFFVRPRKDAVPAPVAFIVPTFTYGGKHTLAAAMPPRFAR